MADEHGFHEFQELIERYELEFQEAFDPQHPDQTNLDDYWLVNLPDKYEQKWADLQRELEMSGKVDWVEYNDQVQIDLPKNITPSRKGRSFGLNDPEVSRLWGLKLCRLINCTIC